MGLRLWRSNALEPDLARETSKTMELFLYNDVQHPNSRQGKILLKK
jgi:hypothetical protein